MPTLRTTSSGSARMAQRQARAGNTSNPKTRSRLLKGRKKIAPSEPTRRSPPLVWPEYPKGGTTIEGMREVERRQEEYIAYHGTYPWAPENLWGPDEDSSSHSDSTEELHEGENKTEGHEYFPESLEDDDLIRTM